MLGPAKKRGGNGGSQRMSVAGVQLALLDAVCEHQVEVTSDEA